MSEPKDKSGEPQYAEAVRGRAAAKCEHEFESYPDGTNVCAHCSTEGRRWKPAPQPEAAPVVGRRPTAEDWRRARIATQGEVEDLRAQLAAEKEALRATGKAFQEYQETAKRLLTERLEATERAERAERERDAWQKKAEQWEGGWEMGSKLASEMQAERDAALESFKAQALHTQTLELERDAAVKAKEEAEAKLAALQVTFKDVERIGWEKFEEAAAERKRADESAALMLNMLDLLKSADGGADEAKHQCAVLREALETLNVCSDYSRCSQLKNFHDSLCSREVASKALATDAGRVRSEEFAALKAERDALLTERGEEKGLHVYRRNWHREIDSHDLTRAERDALQARLSEAEGLLTECDEYLPGASGIQEDVEVFLAARGTGAA